MARPQPEETRHAFPPPETPAMGTRMRQPPAKPRYTRTSFRIGFPVMFFFTVICWLGVHYAAQQILTERAVYQRGVPVTGTVDKKINFQRSREGEQTHYIAYTFQTADRQTVHNEIRVEPTVWNHLQEQGPIAVRYVPGEPKLNLPDGWHMQDFFLLAGGIAFAGAVLFSVILVGMLITLFSGGYRGEPHPLPGQPSSK